MKLRLAFAALTLVSTTSVLAIAQQAWVEDPDIGNGEGVPLGNLDLHPSLAGEFGYDSNYFRRGPGDRDADGNQLPVLDSLRLRITPSLNISSHEDVGHGETSLPIARFRLNSGLYAGYSIFIPLDDTDEFEDRNRLGGGIGARFELFPQRPFTWDVDANYTRTVDPSSVASGDFDFDRHTLGVGTGVTWRPGGGLFDWRVGYDWQGVFFSEGDFELFNNGRHTVSTRGRYRFLPRTAVLFDAHYRLVRYSDTGPQQTQNDGEIIQSQVGVAGLITTRFAFRVMGGWAASFYDPRNNINPQNFDGPVGNAEIKWFAKPSGGDAASAGTHLSSVALGYEHKYEHSYLGPFYSLDRGYLTFRYFLGSSVVTALQGYLAYISYPDFVVVPGTPPVSDVSETRIGGRLFAEYRVASNVGINASILYDRNISDAMFDLNPGVDLSRDDLEYSRFQAFAGVRVFW